MTIEGLCARHRRIALDTNVLIYVLENVPPLAAVGQAIIAAVEAGEVRASIAALGVAELATGPARAGDLPLVEIYSDELRSIRYLSITPTTSEIALNAAIIRGLRRTGLSDAIHLASARAAGATAFVTNDRQIRGSTKLEVVYLDELAAPDG